MGEREQSTLRELKEAAHILFGRGRYAQCAETYERIFLITPKDPNARVRHAEACRRAGSRHRAIASYRVAAKLLVELKCESRARAALRAALELDPEDATLRAELAKLGQALAPTTALEDERLYSGVSSFVEQPAPRCATPAPVPSRPEGGRSARRPPSTLPPILRASEEPPASSRPLPTMPAVTPVDLDTVSRGKTPVSRGTSSSEGPRPVDTDAPPSGGRAVAPTMPEPRRALPMLPPLEFAPAEKPRWRVEPSSVIPSLPSGSSLPPGSSIPRPASRAEPPSPGASSSPTEPGLPPLSPRMASGSQSGSSSTGRPSARLEPSSMPSRVRMDPLASSPGLRMEPVSIPPALFRPELRRLATNTLALRIAPEAPWLIIRSDQALELTVEELLPSLEMSA